MNEKIKISVLFVEDDPITTSFYKRVLAPLVSELLIADNGKTGAELYKAHRPDLVITDVAMPVMNGLEMIEEIRAYDREARFIIMSAFEEPRKFMEEHRVDKNDFLAKPVERNKLQMLITKVSSIIQLEKEIKTEREKNKHQQQLLIHKSKLESLGKLAAGIAHEINQPLGGIAMSIENMHYKLNEEGTDKKYFHDKIESINENINRINQIIEHIRVFSRAQGSELKVEFSVKEAIYNALSLTQTQLHNNGIETDLKTSDKPFIVLGNKFKLEQVLINLITNSRDALIQKRKNFDDSFKPLLTIRTQQSGQNILIDVEDNGSGIDKDTAQLIFDPFFTTKSEGQGTGLGLSISYGIIKEMQGDIEVFSEPSKMTRLRITLPIITKS